MRQLALEYLGKREYSYVELGQKLNSQLVKADFREKRSAQNKNNWRNKNAKKNDVKNEDTRVEQRTLQGNAAFEEFVALQQADDSPASELQQPIDLEAAGLEISAILDDFKTRGWLNDARYTEQMVHARQAKFGVSKIAHELRQKGVSVDLVQDAIEKVKVNELDNAKEIWSKKFKAAPINRIEWAKQARFLQSRGFGFDTIKKVLNFEDNDE